MARDDAARFAKCLVLAERGATEGERAAAMAAAHRIAARYGLSPAGTAAAPSPPSPVRRYGPPRPRPSWMEPRAATMAEMIDRRLEHDAWLRVLRRAEARPARRPRAERQPVRSTAGQPAQACAPAAPAP